ncbi:J domain-containing protein [Mycobacterium colombiense]|uniref:J domain-containing protein n=1 Tax=Mycobacterium colombiense TaxID=339268 RepID=UPI000B2E05F0|nr:J domain-containing protein [Mycobacterium colombiense]
MATRLGDPYAVLGLAPTATADEITRAYRSQVRALHPDTRATPQSNPQLDDRLRQVLTAYALLRDPERRARYDRAATRYDRYRRYRAARRSPTDPQTPAKTGNNLNWVDGLGVVGLTVSVRAQWLSE